MKRYHNDFFDETYYKEVLDNGLEVIIFPKPDFLTTFAGIGTRYGSLNINQKFDGKDYKFNPGVAHFLEHKLFESEEKNIFDLFSNLGCQVNAFTSHLETVYHFSTTNKDIEEPLNLLLDFVQSLNISKQSVEKEKGIIIQELAMYKQEADSRLLEETYKSIYHDYPLKYDIGGDEDSVNRITKEELELAYKINYHPCNMVMMIIGPVIPEEVLSIIKNNQSKKEFLKAYKPVNNKIDESYEVKRKEYSFKMDVNKAKHVYALKLKADFLNPSDCNFKEWCVHIYLKHYFSPINPKYQEWLDEGIINDYFGFEVDYADEYANILFYKESDKDDIKEFIDKALKDDLLSEESLRQIKRNILGVLFRVFNDVSNFGAAYLRDYLNGNDFFENLVLLDQIKLNDLKEAFKEIDFNNYALVHLYPQDK